MKEENVWDMPAAYLFERLQENIEKQTWKVAEEIADRIGFICRQNHLAVNPPFMFRSIRPWQRAPKDRIQAVLSRISMSRVIEREEAIGLVDGGKVNIE